MKVRPGKLEGSLIFEPEIHRDERGLFFEMWQQRRYREAGLERDFVQDMQSISVGNILRGLHYQIANPQGHLVTAMRGSIFDVGLDLRSKSPTFGQWMGVSLDSERRQQVWLPPGIAHGFCVTADVAEIIYKCTGFYTPGDEGGVRWNDPELGIQWPGDAPQVTARDSAFPLFGELRPEQLPRV